MDKMKKISDDFCSPCYFGRLFEGEEIVRCIKRDEDKCLRQKEIDEIEVEIIFH